MAGILIQLDDQAAQAALQRLIDRGADLFPPLNQIGEALSETTKQRFATSQAPDGSTWAPNSPVTVDRLLDKFSGSRKKDGSLSKRGAARAGRKQPLIGESKRLGDEIFHQVIGAGVEIGSGLPYAGVQQFGAAKGAFGSTSRGSPIPWGDIPARPFVGLSDADRGIVEDILGRWLVG